MILDEIKIDVEYRLKGEEKVISIEGKLDSIVEIDKAIDTESRIYRIIRELNRPPTLIEIGSNRLIFKDSKYENMEYINDL